MQVRPDPASLRGRDALADQHARHDATLKRIACTRRVTAAWHSARKPANAERQHGWRSAKAKRSAACPMHKVTLFVSKLGWRWRVGRRGQPLLTR